MPLARTVVSDQEGEWLEKLITGTILEGWGCQHGWGGMNEVRAGRSEFMRKEGGCEQEW